MTDKVDTVVVGAGVVGLAVARALAVSGREVLVLERHRHAGQETSSRNSGVIHSGIYYPKGSLKARLCVRGRDLLYAYCEERGIAHKRYGKLIVAQESQISALRTLQGKGEANGVHDLKWLSEAEVRELEPAVRCAAGLWSPSTGIVDVHEVMTACEADLEAHEGSVIFDSELLAAQVTSRGFDLSVRSGGEVASLECQTLINCGGLSALGLLRKIEGYPPSRLRPAYYAKGNYFVCHGAKPFRHLVYPMPNEAGLGVHATLDLDGTTRFGPDVEWVKSMDDYRVDPSRGNAFYAAIREYWPGLADGSLHAGYSGIRPKLVGPDDKAADFEIEGPQQHGIPGLVNLLGIESPGLTSSLAIGEEVVALH